jgi:hypothetical protein
MSNLSKETLTRINADADRYGFVVPYNGSNKFYNDDKVKGYQEGALHEAERAQDTIDQIDCIVGWMENGTYKSKLLGILAKYKEVSNG